VNILPLLLFCVLPLEVKSAEVYTFRHTNPESGVIAGDDGIRVTLEYAVVRDPCDVFLTEIPSGWILADARGRSGSVFQPLVIGSKDEPRVLWPRCGVGEMVQLDLYLHGGPEAAKTAEKIRKGGVLRAMQR
jgi:hypothetical protein